jgi:hypothetical protein
MRTPLLNGSRTRSGIALPRRGSDLKGWLFLLVLLGAVSSSLGDGGAILKRENLNGLNVTVFASPSPLRAGPVDVSVLVQEGDKPVLDAIVKLEWSADADVSAEWVPPCCAMDSNALSISAVRGHSGNRLLYAAIVPMKSSGRSQLVVRIATSGRQAVLSCDLDLRPPLPPAMAYWPWLLFPAMAIAGFAVHQRLAKSA